jgi:hypothetical protein
VYFLCDHAVLSGHEGCSPLGVFVAALAVHERIERLEFPQFGAGVDDLAKGLVDLIVLLDVEHVDQDNVGQINELRVLFVPQDL